MGEMPAIADFAGISRAKILCTILTANLRTSEDPGCFLNGALAKSWWKTRSTDTCSSFTVSVLLWSSDLLTDMQRRVKIEKDFTT